MTTETAIDTIGQAFVGSTISDTIGQAFADSTIIDTIRQAFADSMVMQNAASMTRYQILDLVASFAAAAGTIFAAGTALYLAKRRRKVRLKVSVYEAQTSGVGRSIAFDIVNRSDFPVRIDDVGWTIPCFFYKWASSINDQLESPESLYLPQEVLPGRSLSMFYIPWAAFEKSLQNLAPSDSVKKFRRAVRKRKIKFYLAISLNDGNLVFDIDSEVMDAFVKSVGNG